MIVEEKKHKENNKWSICKSKTKNTLYEQQKLRLA